MQLAVNVIVELDAAFLREIYLSRMYIRKYIKKTNDDIW